jgi:hypothetical protein
MKDINIALYIIYNIIILNTFTGLYFFIHLRKNCENDPIIRFGHDISHPRVWILFWGNNNLQ